MIKYVFGPVASRRLGISLGVDIIPYKTCNLDCLYCECGKTTDLTCTRQRFMEPRIILEQIKEALSQESHIEYITFSGSGEPTLNLDIGRIISGIKEMTSIPIAVITNGTLLHLKEVREEISQADLVLPSLDAASDDIFSRINKSHPDLKIESIIEGLIQFREMFQGKIWLEIFIAKNINDTDDEIAKLYEAAKKINPDKIQLNSLDRPPAYDDIHPADMKTLEKIMNDWNDLPVEIIKRIQKRNEISSFSKNLENNILNTIKRRPITVEDLEVMTGKNKQELFKYIDVLEKEQKVLHKIVEDKIYYTPFSVPPKKNEPGTSSTN